MEKIDKNRKLKLLIYSCFLDIAFLRLSSLSIKMKIDLILKKYYLLIKHFFIPFKLGKSKISIFDKDFYYNSTNGLFFFQSIVVVYKIFLKDIHKKEVHTVIDVGANVGYASKVLHDIFPLAKIYAIEPIPLSKICLDKNFIHDSYFHSYGLAISDKQGSVKMRFAAKDAAQSYVSEKGELDIQAITLDVFVKKNKISRIDLLKIDTERFEAHVLRGGVESLKITKYLLLEIALVDNENYTFSSIIKLLFSKHYNFQLLKIKNYSLSENEVALFDCLFVNTHI